MPATVTAATPAVPNRFRAPISAIMSEQIACSGSVIPFSDSNRHRGEAAVDDDVFSGDEAAGFV